MLILSASGHDLSVDAETNWLLPVLSPTHLFSISTHPVLYLLLHQTFDTELLCVSFIQNVNKGNKMLYHKTIKYNVP